MSKVITLEKAEQILQKHFKAQLKIAEQSGVERDINRVNQKYRHSYEVLEMGEELMSTDNEFLDLNDETQEIMKVVLLLHDVARFYEIGKDRIGGAPHGEYGAKTILQDAEGIKNQLILLPIKYHDKYNLDGLTEDIEKMSLFAKKDLIFLIARFLKDSDKMANFKFFKNVKYVSSHKIRELYFTDTVVNEFRKCRLVNNKKCRTVFDMALNFLSWSFDLNFDTSREILLRENANLALLKNLRELINTVALEQGNEQEVEEQKYKMLDFLIEAERILRQQNLL